MEPASPPFQARLLPGLTSTRDGARGHAHSQRHFLPHAPQSNSPPTHRLPVRTQEPQKRCAPGNRIPGAPQGSSP